MAVHSSTNSIYLVGYTRSFNIGGGDAFLAKFNSSGALLWNITWGGNYPEEGYGVAVDNSSGSVYLVGTTNRDGASNNDAFLAKYNSSGKQVWNATWGGSNSDNGYGVAVNSSSGNIYIAGTSSSFGGAFLVKYNSSGAQLWNTTWQGGNGHGIAVDPASNSVYLTGMYSKSGNTNSFLAKYNSSGAQLWNATWDGSVRDEGSSVAVDSSSESVYIAGETEKIGGTMDAFLAKYNSSGEQIWNTTWGESYDDRGHGVAVDPLSGSVYLVGRTEFFGYGLVDAFVTKYSSSGAKIWTAIWGATGSESNVGSGIAVDPSTNSIYLSGTTEPSGIGEEDAFLVKNPPPLNNVPLGDDDNKDNNDKNKSSILLTVYYFVMIGILTLGGVCIFVVAYKKNLLNRLFQKKKTVKRKNKKIVLNCPYCYKKLDAIYPACPYCGTNLEESSDNG